MSRSGPIGVFDSGVGGLSILKEIRKLLPYEDFIYFADSAFCPYGGRPPEIIHGRTLAIGKFLLSRGAKLVVVACNTASAAGLNALREGLNVPVVGVEPAVKPAVSLTKNGKVGVLATGVTLASDRFNSLLNRFCDGVEVITQPCPGLVELVEEGRLKEAEPVLRGYLTPLLEQGSKTIVLGCTHYPFLRPMVQEMAGPEVLVIDTGQPVARQVARVLEQYALGKPGNQEGGEEFFTSGDPEKVGSVIELLWGKAGAVVERVEL